MVARYTVSVDDPDVADAGSAEVLLVMDQPASNHNGGQLAFGPDGYLYVATGDGGGGGDPEENGQDLSSLLGKILRLDVDSTGPGLPYAIPPTNPFVGAVGVREEIWAYGLRNPWRFSFDRATGDLWIGDVGQGLWEEIDLQPAASGGGENYGWDCREGAHPYADPNGDRNAQCPSGPFVDPVLEYSHQNGRCSVTGGYRYRGSAEPRLAGVYLYADFCTGEIFGTVPRCDGAWQSQRLLDAPFNITAFGEGEDGEIYVVQFAAASSKVHLVALAPGSGGPDLVVDPGSLDFGSVWTHDTVSAPLTLRNANTGPEALTLGGLVLSDPRFGLDLGRSSADCRSPTRCLRPGESCRLDVRFRSATAGAVSASLTLDGDFTGELVPLAADVTACGDSELTVSGETITGTTGYLACDTLTAGPGLAVAGSGHLSLCGGTRLVVGNGVSVAPGGRLALSNDCPVP